MAYLTLSAFCSGIKNRCFFRNFIITIPVTCCRNCLCFRLTTSCAGIGSDSILCTCGRCCDNACVPAVALYRNALSCLKYFIAVFANQVTCISSFCTGSFLCTSSLRFVCFLEITSNFVVPHMVHLYMARPSFLQVASLATEASSQL